MTQPVRTVQIPADLHAKLKRISQETGIKLKRLVQDAIESGLQSLPRA